MNYFRRKGFGAEAYTHSISNISFSSSCRCYFNSQNGHLFEHFCCFYPDVFQRSGLSFVLKIFVFYFFSRKEQLLFLEERLENGPMEIFWIVLDFWMAALSIFTTLQCIIMELFSTENIIMVSTSKKRTIGKEGLPIFDLRIPRTFMRL